MKHKRYDKITDIGDLCQAQKVDLVNQLLDKLRLEIWTDHCDNVILVDVEPEVEGETEDGV